MLFSIVKDKDLALTVHLRVVLDHLLDLLEAGLLAVLRVRRAEEAVPPPDMVSQNLLSSSLL